jgi:hypothetical protein
VIRLWLFGSSTLCVVASLLLRIGGAFIDSGKVWLKRAEHCQGRARKLLEEGKCNS